MTSISPISKPCCGAGDLSRLDRHSARRLSAKRRNDRDGRARSHGRGASAGADLIGGLDPAGFDGDVKGPARHRLRARRKFGKGIDIHLHDGGETGARSCARSPSGPSRRHARARRRQPRFLARVDRARRCSQRPPTARPRRSRDHDLVPPFRARAARHRRCARGV